MNEFDFQLASIDARDRPVPWQLYYREHSPPHFHAVYGGFEITVEIESGKVNGEFPHRALAHVQEWRAVHRAELLDALLLARTGQPLSRIEPLE